MFRRLVHLSSNISSRSPSLRRQITSTSQLPSHSFSQQPHHSICSTLKKQPNSTTAHNLTAPSRHDAGQSTSSNFAQYASSLAVTRSSSRILQPHFALPFSGVVFSSVLAARGAPLIPSSQNQNQPNRYSSNRYDDDDDDDYDDDGRFYNNRRSAGHIDRGQPPHRSGDWRRDNEQHSYRDRRRRDDYDDDDDDDYRPTPPTRRPSERLSHGNGGHFDQDANRRGARYDQQHQAGKSDRNSSFDKASSQPRPSQQQQQQPQQRSSPNSKPIPSPGQALRMASEARQQHNQPAASSPSQPSQQQSPSRQQSPSQQQPPSRIFADEYNQYTQPSPPQHNPTPRTNHQTNNTNNNTQHASRFLEQLVADTGDQSEEDIISHLYSKIDSLSTTELESLLRSEQAELQRQQRDPELTSKHNFGSNSDHNTALFNELQNQEQRDDISNVDKELERQFDALLPDATNFNDTSKELSALAAELGALIQGASQVGDSDGEFTKLVAELTDTASPASSNMAKRRRKLDRRFQSGLISEQEYQRQLAMMSEQAIFGSTAATPTAVPNAEQQLTLDQVPLSPAARRIRNLIHEAQSLGENTLRLEQKFEAQRLDDFQQYQAKMRQMKGSSASSDDDARPLWHHNRPIQHPQGSPHASPSELQALMDHLDAEEELFAHLSEAKLDENIAQSIEEQLAREQEEKKRQEYTHLLNQALVDGTDPWDIPCEPSNWSEVHHDLQTLVAKHFAVFLANDNPFRVAYEAQKKAEAEAKALAIAKEAAAKQTQAESTIPESSSIHAALKEDAEAASHIESFSIDSTVSSLSPENATPTSAASQEPPTTVQSLPPPIPLTSLSFEHYHNFLTQSLLSVVQDVGDRFIPSSWWSIAQRATSALISLSLSTFAVFAAPTIFHAILSRTRYRSWINDETFASIVARSDFIVGLVGKASFCALATYCIVAQCMYVAQKVYRYVLPSVAHRWCDSLTKRLLAFIVLPRVPQSLRANTQYDPMNSASLRVDSYQSSIPFTSPVPIHIIGIHDKQQQQQTVADFASWTRTLGQSWLWKYFFGPHLQSSQHSKRQHHTWKTYQAATQLAITNLTPSCLIDIDLVTTAQVELKHQAFVKDLALIQSLRKATQEDASATTNLKDIITSGPNTDPRIVASIFDKDDSQNEPDDFDNGRNSSTFAALVAEVERRGLSLPDDVEAPTPRTKEDEPDLDAILQKMGEHQRTFKDRIHRTFAETDDNDDGMFSAEEEAAFERDTQPFTDPEGYLKSRARKSSAAYDVDAFLKEHHTSDINQ